MKIVLISLLWYLHFFIDRKIFCWKTYEKILNNLNYDFLSAKIEKEFYFKTINKLSNDKRLWIISRKDLKYFIKYFSLYSDFITLKSNFGKDDVFIINENLFSKTIFKYFLSHFINTESSIYITNKKNIKNQNSVMDILKLPLKVRLKRNDLKTLSIINNNIINVAIWNSYNFKYFNYFETLKKMKHENICRFGDGEFSLLKNQGPAYQCYDKNLKKDMISTIEYFIKKNKIAINDKLVVKTEYLNCKDNTQFDFIKTPNLSKLKLTNVYSATLWSIPPYIISKGIDNFVGDAKTIKYNEKYISIYDKELYKTPIGKKWLLDFNNYYQKFFGEVSKNKTIVLVSANTNKNFLECNLLSQCSKKIFIPTVERDSYNEKNKILKKILNIFKEYKNDKIIFFIACGPLGKILCKLIDSNNFRFLDIGNFVNYYYYYNDMLPIDHINIIHQSQIFLKLKKSLTK